jgi:DNA gyrase inhibitor GyrI
MTFAVFLFLLAGVLPLLHLQMPPAAADSLPPRVRFYQPVLKDIPPQYFIFKSGAGPYDRLEEEFGPLKEFMAANRITGQLAAVFYDDPLRAPAESLRWEVGIVSPQQLADTDPYSAKIISGRKAASLMVEGNPGQNHGHYANLLGFIRQRRFIFRPPAMEIWLSPGTENSRTEILLPAIQKRRGK